MINKNIELAKKFKKRRGTALRAAAKHSKGKIDGIMITNPVDIRYLCGLVEGSPALLIGKNWATLFTSNMFKAIAAEQSPGADVIIYKELDKEIAAELKSKGVKKIGIQTDHMTIGRYQGLGKTINEKKLLPIPGVIAQCRAIKDEDEIAMTQKAIKIAEKSFKELTGRGAKYFIGKTEKQIATELEYLMRSYGADKQGFQNNGTIVGAGPNSASCHHIPTPRKIKKGDAVLFDWGAELDGYRSDMTRVIFIGSVPKKIAEIYPIVRDGMNAAIDTLKTNVVVGKIDDAARNLITEAGYGPEFRHGLGHGVGLEIHEFPFLAKTSKAKLKKNMIITIEPGIYINGVGGVRLEDDILIIPGGHKNLCKLSTKMEDWII
ncbi:MAG: aminopeptidase P family protein [Phycisphaerae bacterium]|nr:aminopeptidase P family protein [Phycisphaerae bacterium]